MSRRPDGLPPDKLLLQDGAGEPAPRAGTERLLSKEAILVDYKQHPLSAAWPAMDDAAFVGFCADIAAVGLNTPITLFDGMVLDGWHRHLACQQTGTRPRYQDFIGNEAAARRFVISANQMRRHLSPSQISMIAVKFATMEQGRPKDVAEKGATLPRSSQQSIDQAAEEFNISPRTLKDARAVQNADRSDLVDQVTRGEKSVSRAAKEIREHRAQQAGAAIANHVPRDTAEANKSHFIDDDGEQQGGGLPSKIDGLVPVPNLRDILARDGLARLARMQRECDPLSDLNGLWDVAQDLREAEAEQQALQRLERHEPLDPQAIEDFRMLMQKKRAVRNLTRLNAYWLQATKDVQVKFRRLIARAPDGQIDAE